MGIFGNRPRTTRTITVRYITGYLLLFLQLTDPYIDAPIRRMSPLKPWVTPSVGAPSTTAISLTLLENNAGYSPCETRLSRFIANLRLRNIANACTDTLKRLPPTLARQLDARNCEQL